MADDDFIKWLTVAIKAARLPSDAVIFQITEKDASKFVRQTGEFIASLKKMHCQASIGRFGLEAKPFQLLETVQADFVKIDGSHIKTLQKPGDVITPMLTLQSMGKLSIVPMVENTAQLTAFWQCGANYIQGLPPGAPLGNGLRLQHRRSRLRPATQHLRVLNRPP